MEEGRLLDISGESGSGEWDPQSRRYRCCFGSVSARLGVTLWLVAENAVVVLLLSLAWLGLLDLPALPAGLVLTAVCLNLAWNAAQAATLVGLATHKHALLLPLLLLQALRLLAIAVFALAELILAIGGSSLLLKEVASNASHPDEVRLAELGLSLLLAALMVTGLVLFLAALEEATLLRAWRFERDRATALGARPSHVVSLRDGRLLHSPPTRLVYAGPAKPYPHSYPASPTRE